MLTFKNYNQIVKTVEVLKDTHQTSSPFEIAKHENIVVTFTALGYKKGLCIRSEDVADIILINQKLSDADQLLVCAHELAHSILNHNLSKTRGSTAMSKIYKSTYENEANLFAYELVKERVSNNAFELDAHVYNQMKNMLEENIQPMSLRS